MSRYADTIIKMVEEGNDILHIAKLFGGINKLVELSKSNQYLTALIQTKLGGQIYGSAADEDNVMIPFEIPFIIVGIHGEDLDEFPHYNIDVNFLMPELTDKRELEIVYNWLNSYLMDMGAEVGSFNEKKFNHLETWIYPDQINGIDYKKFQHTMDVTDEQFMHVLPKHYFQD